jgi:cytochrome b-561
MNGHSRHRKTVDEDDEEWTGATRCGFGFLLLLALVLIWGAMVLIIFWAVYYRGGFAWKDDIEKQFNLHPVLNTAGIIFFMGQSLLVYRSFRCCKRVYNKLAHTVLHLLAIPCLVVGVIAVFDFHNLKSPPIPNLYSLHSWLGLITMGLFALQFVVGFFSFLILLCCEGATAGFRAALVPIHGTMGLTIFMLGIATAVTGITEKAIFTLKDEYSQFSEEGIVMNAAGVCMIVLGVVMTVLLRHTPRNDTFAPRYSSGYLH